MTGLATAPRRLGVITIGQTPRPDLQAVFAAAAPGVDVVVDGALDTCRPGELTALATEGPDPLLVRLADGSTREVPRDRLVPWQAMDWAADAARGRYHRIDGAAHAPFITHLAELMVQLKILVREVHGE